MPGTLRLDHIVILVDNLTAAVEDFVRLGFSAVWGGKHEAWGSRNALVPFSDGCYLELIADQDERVLQPRQERMLQLGREGHPRMASRVLSWAAVPEGLVDYALMPIPFDEVIEGARAQGLDFEGPLPGGRVRPDGKQVSWEMGLPDGLDLPFLCGDVTPRNLRVPDGRAWMHENGAYGVSTLVVAVTDLNASAGRYESLLGASPVGEPNPGIPEARAVRFACGFASIVLAAPSGDGCPLHEHIRIRGKSPWRLDLHTTAEAATLDPTLAHGARISLVAGPDRP